LSIVLILQRRIQRRKMKLIQILSLFINILSTTCAFCNVEKPDIVGRSVATTSHVYLFKGDDCSEIIKQESLHKRDGFQIMQHPRRSFIKKLVASSSGAVFLSMNNILLANAKSNNDVASLVMILKQAREQLDPVPGLIKEEKWDAVRAILITPPLSDCWGKTSRSILKIYAETIGEELPDGDELAALELREEALDHFRFLDMAVYNNVFNPIRTEGENGATKELIRSYYEDPVKEYNECTRILDGLIGLSKP